MKKFEKEQILGTIKKLKTFLEHNEIIYAFQHLEELADEIEAGIMKKTTQDSPEWYGSANC